MCTNKNKTLFWPACVRVCEHHTHFICMFSFYYWHSCRFFCLHIHIFIYTYTLRVCVHILLLLLLYIYIYFKCFLINRVRARATHDQKSSQNLCAVALLWARWKATFFHYTSACFSHCLFYLSVTLFFIFPSRSRNTRGTSRNELELVSSDRTRNENG